MRDLFRIQEVLDWPAGQQISPNDVKYVLWAGKNILGRETGDSYRKLEYEENKEYYNDMKQDVAAALLGTFGMSEEELSELMGRNVIRRRWTNWYAGSLRERAGNMKKIKNLKMM